MKPNKDSLDHLAMLGAVLKWLPVVTQAVIGTPFTPQLVLAFIEQESGGNQWAVRHEDHYKWLYRPRELAQASAISYDTEVSLQKHSFGLMQLMGAAARERGFTRRYLTELCDPALNLKYSLRHLAWFARIWPTETDYIAAYNAGSPRKNDDDEYVNQRYVDAVITKAKYWQVHA